MEEKERLTNKDIDYEKDTDNCYIGRTIDNKLITWGECLNKLASYENTLLSPEEVEELQHENEQLKLQLSTKNNTLSFAQSSYDLLKEENKKLSGQVNDWKQRFNSSEKRYADLMTSSCECLELKIKSAQTKLAVEKLEELKNYIEVNGFVVWESGKAPYSIKDKINSILAELKGGQND